MNDIEAGVRGLELSKSEQCLINLKLFKIKVIL